ncbi:MAG TPA: hypothetical protein VHW60_03705 [Caulobacteraceae bacterium]|jgi:hypothetical protein|nr:hypothetical protein [Caulobacteraceae bacterium]
MQQWWQYYAVVAGASATLMGLLFVSVSLNAARLAADEPGGPRRLAEQAFRSYVTIILVSLLALFPSLSLTDFGRASLAITASAAILSIYHLHAFIGGGASERKNLLPPMSRRLISAVIGLGLLIYAEFQMGILGLDARDTLAAGTLVLLSSAALTSWDLLLKLGTK